MIVIINTIHYLLSTNLKNTYYLYAFSRLYSDQIIRFIDHSKTCLNVNRDL